MGGKRQKRKFQKSGGKKSEVSPINKKLKPLTEYFSSNKDASNYQLDLLEEDTELIDSSLFTNEDNICVKKSPNEVLVVNDSAKLYTKMSLEKESPNMNSADDSESGVNVGKLLREILDKIEPLAQIQADVKSIKDDLSGLETQLGDHKSRIGNLETDSLIHSNDIDHLRADVEYLKIQKAQTTMWKTKCDELEQKFEKIENDSRQDNLIIHGIKENKQENCKELVFTLLEDKLKILDARKRIQLVKAYRIGKMLTTYAVKASAQSKSRPILVRVLYHPHKQEILSHKHLLKFDRNTIGVASNYYEETSPYENEIWINHDYSDKVRRSRRLLAPVLKMAKQVDKNVFIVNDKIQFKGQRYSLAEVYDTDLDIASIHTTYTPDSVLFYGRFSPFSNFYPVVLCIDGYAYSSVEQYYQYCRAVHVGKSEVAAQIMLSSDPIDMKRLGDQCKSPSLTDTWYGANSDCCMAKALKAKFNKQMFKEILKKTEQRSLVECNKYDSYWSCGFAGTDPKCGDKKAWKGKNLMGSLLEKIRYEL